MGKVDEGCLKVSLGGRREESFREWVCMKSTVRSVVIRSSREEISYLYAQYIKYVLEGIGKREQTFGRYGGA